MDNKDAPISGSACATSEPPSSFPLTGAHSPDSDHEPEMMLHNQPGAWKILPVLVLLYALSLLDRQILILMVEPVKRDLGLNDFHISLLHGIGFAILYSVAALPLGWLADRFPRRPIIWLGVTAWGMAAAACGLAQSFWHLLIARSCVGVGEASLSPAAYSMLADLFRPARLAVAMSILMIGSCLGNGLAIGLGGAIVSIAQKGSVHYVPLFGELKSWQYVFVLTGLPGLFLGALIFLVREPKRRNRNQAKASFVETFRFIGQNRAFFTSHFLGFGLLSAMGYGLLSWMPTYMMRVHHWTIGQLSLPLALLVGIGSASGTIVTGMIIDRLFERGRKDAHMLVYSILALGMAIFAAIAFQASGPWLFLALIAPIILTQIIAPAAAAALQIVTPNQMRGQISALFLLVMNGLGLAIGPAIVGALTDFVFHDEMKVGLSIATMFLVLGPFTAVTLWLGLKPMRNLVEKAEARL